MRATFNIRWAALFVALVTGWMPGFSQSPPVISSISPTSAKPGDAVTLTGSGFNTTMASNIVYFGATKATVTSATASSVTVTVPAGATYAPVTLLNTGTVLIGASLSNFNPIYSPAKSSLSSGDIGTKVDFSTKSGTSINPYSIALGDFDGDGKPDMVVPNNGSSYVNLFRNTSSSSSISFSTTERAMYSSVLTAAIGDVDSDGDLDLAVASSSICRIYPNTSTSGTISLGSQVTVGSGGSGTKAIAMGDLDGDGKLDLAVVAYASNKVSVFRNTSTSGTISFASKVDFATGTDPRDVAISDLDGDGKLDLVVANYSSTNVSVFHNTSTSGTISFASKVDFTTEANPRRIAIGDLDGDGKPDLAVAYGTSSVSNVSVFRNTSTSGTIDENSFASKVDFATNSIPESVAIGDLDGDGKLDMAVVNAGSDNVSVFRNTSTSGTIDVNSFASKVDFNTADYPHVVAIGDLDGDGRPDLAAVNHSSKSVSVLLNGVCTHPTSGGTVAAAQSGSSPFDPAAFTSSAAASGETGTLEYKWQSSTTGSSSGFTDISGATSATYDPGALTQTTWYKRLARVSCAVWTGAAESNVIEVTVHSSFTWNGSESTDWNTAANWTPNFVPSTGASINFPSGLTRYPELPSTVTVTSLTVTGASLALGSSVVTLTGNLTNNGSIAGSGKLVMAGSSAQTISGTGTVQNLEVNNSAGVTISAGSGNMQTITGTLTPTSGTLTTNGNLTLKSDASGTARVGAGSASGGYISGDVITQRHLTKLTGTGRNGRAWRLVSVPVEGTGTLLDYFMAGSTGADLTASANRLAEPAGLGTVVIGHNYSNSTDAINAGFDWIGVSNQVSSLRYYTQSSGSGSFASAQVPSLSTTYTDAAQGYMLFARGDRQQEYYGTTNSSTTVLQATGSLKQGTKNVPIPGVASAGYVLVGNPYMAVIDMELVYNDNSSIINPIVYIWDANTDGNSYCQGGYRTVTRSGSGVWTSTGAAGANPQYIESQAAFFVVPTSAGGTLQIKEAHKVTGTPGISPHGTDGNNPARLFVNLEVMDTASRRLVDGVVVFFDAYYKEGLGDAVDIASMSNITAGALGLKQSGLRLAMEGRPWPADSLQRLIPVDMRNLGDASYMLRLIGTSLTKEGFRAWLKDHHLKTETALKVDGELLYPFRRTGDAGIDSGRFEIVYRTTPKSTGGTVTPDDASETPIVKLFPNPSKTGDVKLSLRAMAPGAYTVQVLDMLGREVATGVISHQTMNGEYRVLKGTRLSPGQYIIRLMDADKQAKETLRMVVE